MHTWATWEESNLSSEFILRHKGWSWRSQAALIWCINLLSFDRKECNHGILHVTVQTEYLLFLIRSFSFSNYYPYFKILFWRHAYVGDMRRKVFAISAMCMYLYKCIPKYITCLPWYYYALFTQWEMYWFGKRNISLYKNPHNFFSHSFIHPNYNDRQPSSL